MTEREAAELWQQGAALTGAFTEHMFRTSADQATVTGLIGRLVAGANVGALLRLACQQAALSAHAAREWSLATEPPAPLPEDVRRQVAEGLRHCAAYWAAHELFLGLSLDAVTRRSRGQSGPDVELIEAEAAAYYIAGSMALEACGPLVQQAHSYPTAILEEYWRNRSIEGCQTLASLPLGASPEAA